MCDEELNTPDGLICCILGPASPVKDSHNELMSDSVSSKASRIRVTTDH